MISKYFVKSPSVWRGLGEIAESAIASPEYARLTGHIRFGCGRAGKSGCLCGMVITAERAFGLTVLRHGLHAKSPNRTSWALHRGHLRHLALEPARK
jgi:hypothetical protein